MLQQALLVLLFLVFAAPPGWGAAPRTAEERQADTRLFTALLSDHVKDGRVDYDALCRDPRLAAVTARFGATDPESIAGKNQRLAFWINVYNAFTLKVICDNYPVESINDLHTGGLIIGTVINKTIWDKNFVVINGRELSLNHIEHDIVRPVFQDARAHFALVCASKSCPPLRSEAYLGERLSEQLDDQGRLFFSQTDKNTFDVPQKHARLSKILDWYGGDFGSNDREILLYITRFLSEPVAGILRATADEWKVDHTRFDWSLND